MTVSAVATTTRYLSPSKLAATLHSTYNPGLNPPIAPEFAKRGGKLSHPNSKPQCSGTKGERTHSMCPINAKENNLKESVGVDTESIKNYIQKFQ